MAEDISNDSEQIRSVLENAKALNIVGMKDSGAANGVPLYMQNQGYKITGINPKFEELDGVPFFPDLESAGPSDIVVVFRRSDALPGHLDDFLKSDASTIWFQLGIRNDEVAQKLTDAGFDVVQDRCIKVEHARLVR